MLISGIRAYSKGQYKLLLFTLILAVSHKYLFHLAYLTGGSLSDNRLLLTFYYGWEFSDLFKNLIVGVDAVSLIGGIFGYYKKNYKLLLGFIILALVFQYFGLIMVLIV